MLRYESPRLRQSAIIPGKGSVGVPSAFRVASGLMIGAIIGLLVVAPPGPPITSPVDSDRAPKFTDVNQLSPDELQTLIMKALSRLSEQQGLTPGFRGIGSEHTNERVVTDSRREAQLGIENLRRLLPSAKRCTAEALQEAASDLEPAEWPRVIRLIRGVTKIVRNEHLAEMAAVRDDRLSEIFVNPDYASYLTSDDEAIFLLAHELTHVAARSEKLNGFIQVAADRARSCAQVEATDDQREDLACDFVGELVLKRFIALNPSADSAAVRMSRVLGYESRVERFARAWDDFCYSYNGDPGDADHLNQYKTIRALWALDPELQCLMPHEGE